MINSTKTTIDIKQRRRNALRLGLLMGTGLLTATIISFAHRTDAHPNKAQQFFQQVCPSAFHKWEADKSYGGHFFDDCTVEIKAGRN